MYVIQSLGKLLVIFGIILVVMGGMIFFGAREGIGRLSGDIMCRKGSFAIYFPLVVSIILSILLTLLFNLPRFKR